MAVLSDYVSGTITLTNGSNAFTGTGTGWLAASFREGDTILGIESNAGVEYVIASITGNGAGTLTQNWEGASGTYTYRMRYLSDGARVTAQAAQLVELLGNGNLQALAGLTGPGVPVFNGPHSMTIKPETDFINGVAYDVQVDTLPDRAAYDGQSEGFAVLVADVGDGRSALYTKNTNTSGDWSDPAYVTGPVGPLPDVEATVAMLPPGSTAVVTEVPITGGVRLDFELPEASGFYNAGVYDIGEAYDQDDVVRHDGSSFIALQAVPAGESPSNAVPPVDTAYWQVLAVKGQDGTGTGDVVGPSGAVTDRIAVFDGTTGKLIKDGGVTIDELQPEGVVRYDEGQSLSAGEKLQARENIYAASSMDFRPNISVNGSLIDSQENGDTLGTANGYFYGDQHALYRSGTLGVSVQRVAYTSLAGGKYAGEFKCTTAKTTLGATDLVTDTEVIEGSRPEWVAAGFGAAGAKQFVYRKEVQKPAGLYHFHFSNSAANRHCAVPYTITPGQANAKTVVEVVVPGDTSGTWLKTDGVIGMVVDDVLAAGSTYTGGSASTWGGTAYYAASTQANFLSSTANVARHTDFGLKLDPDVTGVYGAYEVGEVDAVYRSERYYLSTIIYGVGSRDSGLSNGELAVPFQIPAMAKTPVYDSVLDEGSADGEGSQRSFPGQVGWSFIRTSVTGAILVALTPGGQSTTINAPWRVSTIVKANARLS